MRLFWLVFLGFAGAAEAQMNARAEFGAPDAPQELLIRAAADLAFFAPVLEDFSARHPDIRVVFEDYNTNVLYSETRAACADPAPDADLVLSSAVDLQVRLVNDGCARPYRSARTQALAAALNWRDELFGVTQEPAVMVYNRKLVPEAEVPQSRFDLLDLMRRTDGRYQGRIATYDIERSGVGYLLAFSDSLQATTFGSLLEAFGRSGAVRTCCSVEIIQGVEEGRYLLAYNVLGSYALARAAQNPDLGLIAASDYLLVLHRAAFIPKGARHPAQAGLFLDYLLSPEGRAALAAQNLIVEAESDPRLNRPQDGSAYARPIPLAPTLLLGLDRMKRAAFLKSYRARTMGAGQR